jgi:tetratricopeptide (TPR) repeat protein
MDYEINKELGECYLFMGELEKAEEYYKKAAISNGVHPDPYLGLATIAVQRGELEQAMNLYKKAYKIEADDKSLAGMGLILAEKGQVDESFNHFVQALEKNPANLVALFGMVQIGHHQERLPDVVPFLEKYLESDPDKHEVRYTLAGCLVCMDKPEEAKTHLDAILAKDPENEAAKELLEQMDD